MHICNYNCVFENSPTSIACSLGFSFLLFASSLCPTPLFPPLLFASDNVADGIRNYSNRQQRLLEGKGQVNVWVTIHAISKNTDESGPLIFS